MNGSVAAGRVPGTGRDRVTVVRCCQFYEHLKTRLPIAPTLNGFFMLSSSNNLAGWLRLLICIMNEWLKLPRKTDAANGQLWVTFPTEQYA